MDKVAVVILNWNGAKMMQRFLPNIIKYTRGTIYVADNASTDDSLNILAKDFPKVKTILLDKNYGFAEGYNKALAKINAEYFVLLNSDVEVKDDWLTPLIDFMDRHPKIAACQPKILSQSHPDTFEYAGASGGFLDSLGYPYCRGRIFDTLEQDNGQYNTSLPIFWATGAAMTVRSAVYLEVGGLDGRFFAHMEEIDFCWRLRSRGYGIVCLPTSTVYHVGGGTLPQNNPQKIIPAFGLHPWYLDKRSKNWEKGLAEMLQKFPQALVGECGLDKLKNPEQEPQREVFIKRLLLFHVCQ